MLRFVLPDDQWARVRVSLREEYDPNRTTASFWKRFCGRCG